MLAGITNKPSNILAKYLYFIHVVSKKRVTDWHWQDSNLTFSSTQTFKDPVCAIVTFDKLPCALISPWER